MTQENQIYLKSGFDEVSFPYDEQHDNLVLFCSRYSVCWLQVEEERSGMWDVFPLSFLAMTDKSKVQMV